MPGKEVELQPDGRQAVQKTPRIARAVRHELRSSIGQVLGYSELWLDEIEAGEDIDMAALKRDLERVHAAGSCILDIVNEHVDPVSRSAGGATDDRSG